MYVYRYMYVFMVCSTTPHVPARGHPQAANMYMHPGGHPPQRAYAIRGHKSARSSAHRLRYTCTQERTPSTDEHVLGTPYAPVRAPPQRAYIYTHPRGHPPGEHMPYASSRAHARGKLRLGHGELSTFTQCNIQHQYTYIHEHIYNVFTYCVCICMYTGTCMYLWCAPPPPHVPARGHPQAANMYMHPGGHPPQRAYAIRGHKSARSSAHRLRYTCTQERTPSTEEHVLGTPYAPVRAPPQ
jgi:hypothetical protein